MSRSYKHNPICKDHSKGMKRIANQHLRRKDLEEIPNGMAYKKMFEPWKISDWSFRYTFNEYLQSKAKIEDRNDFTKEEIDKFRNEWKRMHFRK